MKRMTDRRLGVVIFHALNVITQSNYLSKSNSSDRALYLMYKIHSKDILDLIENIIEYARSNNIDNERELTDFICGGICPSFRKLTIVDDDTKGCTDMVFWHLINCSRNLGKAIDVAVKYYFTKDKDKYTFSDLVEFV